MNQRFRIRPLLTLAAALLTACSSTGGVQPGRNAADIVADAAKAPAAPPPEVAAALLPPATGISTASAAQEPRFDVSVENVPARAFFMSLANDTPYNIVVGNELFGSISLQMRAASVPEVMDVVREVFGYEYQRSGNTFMVKPAELRTQIFEVNYLNVKRTGNSRTRVSSGQSTETDINSDTQQSGIAQTVTDSANTKETSGTRIETDSEASFWEGLEKSLNAMVGMANGRSVVVNPLSGVVIVHALPAELRSVSDVIQRMQSIATRQVILEAKIVEVELRDGFQSGIDWALLRDNARSSALIGQHGAPGTGETPTRILDLLDGNGNFVPFTTNGGLGSNPFGGAFSAALTYHDFAAFVELLETQGRTQVLSSPRVATVNNQKAVIKVGSDEFFVTGVTSSTTTGGSSSNSNRNIILTPFFSGIALDVTPQISEKGEVILHIHPTVSEVTDQTKNFTVGGLDESLPLAFSTVREADSIVRTSSGNVVVIGGMMKDSSSRTSNGIPLLGRIPGFGNLFKHRGESTNKSELVILLRATVVNSDQDWRNEAESSSQRLRELGQ